MVSMKKLLITLAALVALVVPTSALAVDVVTPQGVLHLSMPGEPGGQGLAVNEVGSFDFAVDSVPRDEGWAGKTDSIAEWVWGPGADPALTTMYPGYINYQLLDCVRVILQSENHASDTGWHCSTSDNYLPDQDSMAALIARGHAQASEPLSGEGTGGRAPWRGTDGIFPEPDLTQFIGETVSGMVYSNACTRLYLDANFYPPGGESEVNNELGCVGSADPFGGMRALSVNSDPKLINPTGPADNFKLKVAGRAGIDCHVPKLRGLKLRQAKIRLHKNQCLAKVRYLKSRRYRGKVIGSTPRAGAWRLGHARVRLVVGR